MQRHGKENEEKTRSSRASVCGGSVVKTVQPAGLPEPLLELLRRWRSYSSYKQTSKKPSYQTTKQM